MQAHAGKCKWKNECELEAIVGYVDKPNADIRSRKYIVRWKGYSQEDDSLLPFSNLHPETVIDFEMDNNCYDHE